MLGSTMSGIIPAPSNPDEPNAIWIDDAATAPALNPCDDNIYNRLENDIDLKGMQCVRVTAWAMVLTTPHRLGTRDSGD